MVRLPASMADDRLAVPRTPAARDAASDLSGVRILLAVSAIVTAAWAWVLLERASSWLPRRS